jgi:hypothetical protein
MIARGKSGYTWSNSFDDASALMTANDREW